jgi:hypothetical protein
MEHSAIRLMWVFLAAPWLTWVVFHPLADARLAWALVARPREARAAVVEMLHNAYDVPPFSYMFNAESQPNVLRWSHKTSFTYRGKSRTTLGESPWMPSLRRRGDLCLKCTQPADSP